MTSRSVTVHLKGNISDFNRAMLGAGATAKTFSKSLDTSTDRMGNLVQSSLALGPALVPIGAAAIPAIAGLTNQLAFAAVGAGVTALAFSGVGSALDAVNKYSLEPSTENFAKMQETLATLGPAGQDFVMFLQEIRPELQRLQDAAQEGLFPGAQEGITELMELLPQAERIVSTVAKSIGDLIAEAGDNLNDPRWREFFDFIESEARPTLMDMGRTLGNFAEGFANLWMAFDPVSDNFSQSFLQMSRDFAEWTDGLSQTQGFQEFIEYITRVGPKAWETLSALGNAFVEVLEAAAPIGEVALPIIEALADGIAAVADSDLGPVLIGVVSLTAALSRMKALATAANSSAIGGLFGASAIGGAGRAAKDLPAATRAWANYDAAMGRATTRAGKASAMSTRLGTALRGTAKLAGGAGGLAFVMSDLDDKMGLSNTASLALMGTLAGPWGAAVGAGVGLAMDFAAANDDIGDAVDRANGAVGDSSLSLQQRIAAVDASLDVLEKKRQKMFASQNGITGAADTSDVDAASKKLLGTRKELTDAAQEQRFAEAGISEAMRGASQATRDQTFALLENIDTLNRDRNAALDARAGQRSYEQAVDDAAAAVKENGKTLDINTEAGRKNEAALDGIASAWNNLEDQTAKGAMQGAHDDFVRAAMAMGKTREAAEALADKLIEMPAEIVTLFKAPGAKGAIDTAAAVAHEYGLTPDLVETQLKALNYTKPQIDAVKKAMKLLDAMEANPKLRAENKRLLAAVKAAQNAIDRMHGKTVYINTVHTNSQRAAMNAGKADGGEIRGPGGPRDDIIPIMASNREFMVNAVDAQANLPLLHDINSGRFRYSKPQGYADGGQIMSRLGSGASFGDGFSGSHGGASRPPESTAALITEAGLTRALTRALESGTFRTDSRGNMKLILSGA